MFVDLVGYTKKTTFLTTEKFNELHDIFDGITLPIFTNFQGKVINKIGDAYLVSFESATSAVHCGITLQKEFQKLKNLKIRVAIHGGEVLQRKTGIYGDTVNAAARIESITKSGDIVFSEFIFQAMNKNEISCQHLGLFKLKGLRFPLRLFKVKKQKKWWEKIKSKILILLANLAIITLIIFSAFVYNQLF
jgi:class 3 adenylate cyclase